MSDERPANPDLRRWGNDALQALSDAFDKVVRSREASPGIDVADARAQDWFDLAHLDPAAPGKFPGVGGIGPAASDRTVSDRPDAGTVETGSAGSGPAGASPRPVNRRRPPRRLLPGPRRRRPIRNRRRRSRSCWPSSTP